jgi:hypothetical protein
MAARKQLVSTLDIFSPGPRYKVDYHGFGGYVGFADLETDSERGLSDWSALDRLYIANDSFEGDTEGLAYGANFLAAGSCSPEELNDGIFPSLRVVPDPVNCVMLMPGVACTGYHTDPYPGYSTEDFTAGYMNVDLNYFYPFGAHQDKWTDGADEQYFAWNNFPLIGNLSSADPGSPRALQSIFKLPAEPIFAFVLHRAQSNDYPVVTSVVFSAVDGAGSYAYIMPEKGKPYMVYGNGTDPSGFTPLRRVSKGSGGSAGGSVDGILRAGSSAREEMSATVIWIGFFGPYVAVSGDGFASISDCYWRTVGPPTVSSPVGQLLPSAPSTVAFVHVGGQFAIAWLPLFTPDYGNVYSNVVDLPFALEDMETSDPYTHYRHWISCPMTTPVLNGAYQAESGMIRIEKGGSVYPGAPSTSRVPDGRGIDFISTLRRRTYTSFIQNASTGGGHGDDFPVHSLDPWGDLGVSRAYDRYSLAGSGGFVGNYYHDQGVCLFRTDYWKNSVLTANTSRTYTRHYPLSFSYDISKDANVADTRVDNVASESGDFSEAPFADMQDGSVAREVQLSAIWYGGDGEAAQTLGSIPGFGGVMTEPSTSIDGAGGRCKILTNIQMRDFHSMGLDVVADGTLPVFDGWYVKDSIEWLLDYMGIGNSLRTARVRTESGGSWSWGTSYSIEDLGTRLNIGPTDKPFWVIEEGRPVMDLVAEMCLYDHGAALICQGGTISKCCPHCMALRNPTSSSVNYAPNHYSNGPYSPGCYTSDVALSPNGDGIFHYFTTVQGDAKFLTYVSEYEPLKHEIFKLETQPFDLSNYYNSVKVKGKSSVYDEEPRDAEMTDWASVHGDYTEGTTVVSLGRKKTLDLSYDWANTKGLRNYLCYLHYSNVAQWTKTVTITVPYDQNYHLGETFAIFGPEADTIHARNKVFRIMSVGHNNDASRAPISTTLRGRWMWTIT